MTWRLLSSITLIIISSTSIFTSEYYIFNSINATNNFTNNITFNQTSNTISGSVKVSSPTNGVYQGANPDFGGTEDEVTSESILNYERLIDKKIVWAYFSNNWVNDIEFPEESVRMIDGLDIVPFIRMMPRTTFNQGEADPVYTLQGIIDGDFDDRLIQWAQDAKRTNIPIMVEFGTEVNGNWFPWSGLSNGDGETEGYGDPSTADGPERFRDAYRHIIDLFRNEEANNITWVFHVFPSHEIGDGMPSEESWNSIQNYYPGDEYIDWIGTSVYASSGAGKEWKSFTDIMDVAYPELESLSNEKPFAIFELGIIEDPEMGNKSGWIQDALQSIENNTYPRIKAISYWNEKWNDGDKTIDLTLNSSSETVNVYKEIISSPFFLTDAQYQYNE